MEGLGGKEQIVGMSEGFIENDKVVITSGPLVGREGLAKHINCFHSHLIRSVLVFYLPFARVSLK